jgi:SAM-dependent methyltransferase
MTQSSWQSSVPQKVQGARSSLHTRFNSIELVDPRDGYAERNACWFEKNILPDFLAVKTRLDLGSTLLDVGCGYGYFTLRYAPYFDYVLGVDFSETRIEGARVHNSRDNVEYLVLDLVTEQLVNANGRPVPAPGESAGDPYQLQCAVTSAVFQHIPPEDRVAAFRTVFRALGKHKYLVMYDERFEDRPNHWDGFYEPISASWFHRSLSDLCELKACRFVATAIGGASIYRYEVYATS